jgi:hypothetical protein
MADPHAISRAFWLARTGIRPSMPERRAERTRATVAAQKSDNVPLRVTPSAMGSMQRGSSFAGEFTSVLTG